MLTSTEYDYMWLGCISRRIAQSTQTNMAGTEVSEELFELGLSTAGPLGLLCERLFLLCGRHRCCIVQY
jgi:hypothetical protein